MGIDKMGQGVVGFGEGNVMVVEPEFSLGEAEYENISIGREEQ
jgi:hypothetical protein